MTITSDTQFSAPLGVGNIVSESFSILFRNFFKVMILAFVPTLIGLIISGVLIGWGMTIGYSSPQALTGFSGVRFTISTVAQIAVYGITIALLVQLAYDAKLNRPLSIGRYFSPAIRAAFPILVLMTVASLLVGLAMIALVIPGLWVYAVFSVLVPAVVIDRAGFGALSRSANLTKEYRWPVLGAIILVGICTVLLNFVAMFLAGIVAPILGGGIIGIFVSAILLAALNGVAYGLSGISVALIYARLRAIKEGVSVDDLASVFE